MGEILKIYEEEKQCKLNNRIMIIIKTNKQTNIS